MTDNEIIKLLECCKKSQCSKCYYSKECDGYTQVSYALDLINRQQEAIEKLQKNQDDIDNFARDICKERMLKGKAIANFDDFQEYIRKEKTEAIKEFAERLKLSFFNNGYESPDVDFDYFIDNLVKEYEKGRQENEFI